MSDEFGFQGIESTLPQKKKRLGVVVVTFISLLVIGFLMFAGQKLFFAKSQKPNKSPGFVSKITPTVSPSPMPTQKISKAPTIPSVSKSTLKVSVLNGSGKEGAAGVVASELRSKGYSSLTVGNASAFNYQGITLRVKKGQSDISSLLKKDLASFTVVVQYDLPTQDINDAVIIVGK